MHITPFESGEPAQDNVLRGNYVTLSHCWGGTVIPKLEKGNEHKLISSIFLSELPATFRDAIQFARSLDSSIRYMWIDSLCIRQGDDEDWAQESIRMYDVYRNSFLNISATAALNSSGGLYYRRNPQHLWDEEIKVNIEGLPRSKKDRAHKRLPDIEPLVRRCKIQDASYWHRNVDDAAVNRRGWVLQERVLASRVLHFCEDQIAWECQHIDATESFPYGIPDVELKGSETRTRTRIKPLVPAECKQENPGIPSEVPLSDEADAAHEKWKAVVERYSTTALSYGEDKLIAIAGIAELISYHIGTEVSYVAGMWKTYLASQILWYTRPR
ncbi:heterokaryon incompatibility protein-domain-containing protein [Dendryphion nanum]|uniref:Heterokaryon incompatibility protein-domain-containing protein n=1 Tax=Dendryphion nanum TaxID=256645 RepID=A0A9P9EIW2_9PLEO|nr:heterokaryon incompatibility protein-domain-containing protein [Dendryphion nanum]